MRKKRVEPKSRLTLRAPAKINLGLEVTGRRADGYHEVVTILQTVSIFDEIGLAPSDRFLYEPAQSIDIEHDLTMRAIDAARSMLGIDLLASVRLCKLIPVAAGLGGGSSDAGTLLGALAVLAGVSLEDAERCAAGLGSDVPFFVRGGTSLATGTGVTLQPLAALGSHWFVVVTPGVELANKTRSLYTSLNAADFTDGGATRLQADRIQSGLTLEPALLRNVFTRPLREIEPVQEAWDLLARTGPLAILPSGAGPSLVALFPDRASASRAIATLALDGTQGMLCRSVGPHINDAVLKTTLRGESPGVATAQHADAGGDS